MFNFIKKLRHKKNLKNKYCLIVNIHFINNNNEINIYLETDENNIRKYRHIIFYLMPNQDNLIIENKILEDLINDYFNTSKMHMMFIYKNFIDEKYYHYIIDRTKITYIDYYIKKIK